jgi:hypothetical protein
LFPSITIDTETSRNPKTINLVRKTTCEQDVEGAWEEESQGKTTPKKDQFYQTAYILHKQGRCFLPEKILATSLLLP